MNNFRADINPLAIAILLGSLLTVMPARAQAIINTRDCTADHMTCHTKVRDTTVQMEMMPDGKNFRRVVIFSEDMKRDKDDFLLMGGGLMMIINPQSTADERGDLMMSLLSNGRKTVRWSGFAWQLGYSDTEAIRLVAERL
jgi:hypothetical protein